MIAGVVDPESFRAAVADRLAGTGAGWRVEVVDQTGSTNDDLAAKVRAGDCGEWAVLVALEQSAGRGRLTRSWTAPPGTGLALSMAVPLPDDPASWGLVPLAAGVAVQRAVARFGVRALLKWPNDVLVGERKLAGILATVVGRVAVIGAGVNISQTAENIGYPAAVSLAMVGVEADRADVAAAVLAEAWGVFGLLDSVEGRADLLRRYREVSATVGRQVRVETTAGSWVEGTAVDIASDGELLVDVGGEVRGFASGDVYHVR